uniref:Cyclin N-terminal domain-containing protein n=1 Tax=Megaviridae environmental sample TaxID=1737588 RepID=A0A5J6VJX1_9VIRU|nr:MAG: hypothetical protein [Megaviridae environmental sample]
MFIMSILAPKLANITKSTMRIPLPSSKDNVLAPRNVDRLISACAIMIAEETVDLSSDIIQEFISILLRDIEPYHCMHDNWKAEVLIHMYVYMGRLMTSGYRECINIINYKIYIAMLVLLSSKWCLDYNLQNIDCQIILCNYGYTMSLQLLNRIEITLLEMLEFNLMVKPAEYMRACFTM